MRQIYRKKQIQENLMMEEVVEKNVNQWGKGK